jgi:hypothetical protein
MISVAADLFSPRGCESCLSTKTNRSVANGRHVPPRSEFTDRSRIPAFVLGVNTATGRYSDDKCRNVSRKAP